MDFKMDYSHPYFAGAQPYQFMGMGPLTPSHSNSAGSEEYSTTSPPEVYGDFPNEQFQNFEQYAAHFNLQHAFPASPTPPNQQAGVRGALPQQLHPSAPHTNSKGNGNGSSNGSGNSNGNSNGNGNPGVAAAAPEMLGTADTESPDEAGRNVRLGSNSEEDDLTPAQSRRKAQNRAAQRAFRERKERHVKDLEAKLALLEAAQQQTATENERLKRDLQKISTENKILRATSSMQNGDGSGPGLNGAAPIMTGPLTYNPMDFYSNVLANHANKGPAHRIVETDDGDRLYAVGAAWDFIINHETFRKGLVDIADVSNRLKHHAICDGQGPVFEERIILKAIEESVASGSDELL